MLEIVMKIVLQSHQLFCVNCPRYHTILLTNDIPVIIAFKISSEMLSPQFETAFEINELICVLHLFCNIFRFPLVSKSFAFSTCFGIFVLRLIRDFIRSPLISGSSSFFTFFGIFCVIHLFRNLLPSPLDSGSSSFSTNFGIFFVLHLFWDLLCSYWSSQKFGNSSKSKICF